MIAGWGFFVLFYNYYLEKYTLKDFLINFAKSSCVVVFLFSNYVIMRFSLSPLKNLLDDKTPENLRLFQLFLLLYFQFFNVCIKKLLFVYTKFISSQIKESLEPSLFMMRISLSHLMAISISTLLKIEFNGDWSKWVTLFFHLNFVFNFYTRINLIEVLSKTILRKENKIYKCLERFCGQSSDKEYIKFQRVFSGTMIDMQIICILRLLFWTYEKRWLTFAYTTFFFKNCKLEISDNFVIGNFGFVAVLIINLILPVGLLVTLIIKQKGILEYKMNRSKGWNVCILFGCSIFFDNVFQPFYVY